MVIWSGEKKGFRHEKKKKKLVAIQICKGEQYQNQTTHFPVDVACRGYIGARLQKPQQFIKIERGMLAFP